MAHFGPSSKVENDRMTADPNSGRTTGFNDNLHMPELWRPGQDAPTLHVEGPIQANDVTVTSQEIDIHRYGEAWEPHGFYRTRQGSEGDFDFDHDGDND